MKRITLYFALCLSLSLVFITNINGQWVLPDCQVFDDGNYRGHVTPANLQEEIDAVVCFYEEILPELDDEFVFQEITTVFESLMAGQTYEPAYHSRVDFNFVDNPSYGVTFTYENDPSCVEFDGGFIDFKRSFHGTYSSLNSPYNVYTPGGRLHRLIYTKATCGEAHSGVFFIIIEQDIQGGESFILAYNQYPGGPSLSPRLQAESQELNVSQELNLSVFPNPVKTDLGNISFDLPKEQDVSITLIEAASGKMLRSHNQYFQQGHHQTTLDLSNIQPGFYFIELKTKEGRIVQSLIKTE